MKLVLTSAPQCATICPVRLTTHHIHRKSNLRKLKEVDAAREGEGFGHGVGSLVAVAVVVVVAAVLVVVVPAALLPGHVPGTRGLRPGGVEESRHEIQPE